MGKDTRGIKGQSNLTGAKVGWILPKPLKKDAPAADVSGVCHRRLASDEPSEPRETKTSTGVRATALLKSMTEKILLIDDEPAILYGYQRLLHGAFKADIATDGKSALAAIEKTGPYAVVVSDMCMPRMDGAELLAEIRVRAPDTVRIMLTGKSDIHAATKAVNEGHISRFLTKPCNKELLAAALTAAIEQYRLVSAERQLLEQTLSGSIQMLTEVLSLVNPAAFSRAARARRYVHHIVSRLSLANAWQFEMAAMLSQLGCVAIDPEIIDAVYAGRELSPEQQELYDTHPMIARDLLANISRMESVAWIIAHQKQAIVVDGDIANPVKAKLRLGAEILEVTLAFDDLLRKGLSRSEAATRLSRKHKGLDRRIFEALVELEPEAADKQVRRMTIAELAPGMIVEQEIRSRAGALLAAEGQEVTLPLIIQLENLHGAGGIESMVQVSSPKEMTS